MDNSGLRMKLASIQDQGQVLVDLELITISPGEWVQELMKSQPIVVGEFEHDKSHLEGNMYYKGTKELLMNLEYFQNSTTKL